MYVRQAEARLRQAGIENPALDARLLIGHAFGLDRAELLSQSERILTADEIARAEVLLERRGRHESVARIIGQREFWGLPFDLNEATLEPRPDSETLIETALDRFKPGATCEVLDLGTGSGCLLLSLLHEWQQAQGIGVDASPRAAAQAAANADALGLSSRARFVTGNWFDAIDVGGTFDVIVSNPPYISTPDLTKLMDEVRDYDPALALDGGADGLDAYKAIIPKLRSYLKPKGFVVFEVGVGQAEHVSSLLAQSGFQDIVTRDDFNAVERCVSAMAPS